jgi:hypothetical protein
MSPTEDELHEIAKRRVEARSGFMIHAAIYVIANLGFVIIWALTGGGYPWFMWPLIGWGIGITAHALGFLFGPGRPREARAIEREVERLHASPRH